MNSSKRPLSVTIIGCVYLTVGAVGFVYHFRELESSHAFPYDAVAVELSELLAILCGGFMLRGHNWARWVALAWIVFHVVLSTLHSFGQFAVHCLFCAVITWSLFHRGATRYFRDARSEPT